MKTTRSRALRVRGRDTYFQLVERFPLRPIRSATQHKAALSVIDQLMARGDDTLKAGESDYLETLAALVARYEAQRFPISKASPLDVLKHLMDARDMRPSDLGKLIGMSTATHVLKGERELSKSAIRMLADHFHVSPALFI